MQKIIAFGASNSPESINKQLAVYTANQIQGAEVQVLDLIDFDLPVYGRAIEQLHGIPKAAQNFAEHIASADALVISLAEHNGLFTAAFKNLWDWMSRLGNMKIWNNKNIFLLATSPGARSERYVMKVALDLFPLFGGQVVANFTLPSFYQNFQNNEIIDDKLREQFQQQLNQFQAVLNVEAVESI